ncbi:MAG: TonB-dependent receptor, partial [Bacteroidota bacterium]|nr:TonB-dependent receptor [Bacteroidota bacterium]
MKLVSSVLMSSISVKNNYIILFFFLYLCIPMPLKAQIINIKGSIKDSHSKENLIGATLQQQGRVNGGVTNNYGVYHMVLQYEDSIMITVRSIGYRPLTTSLVIKKDTVIDFLLDAEATTLDNVEVFAYKNNIRGRNTNIVTLPLERMKEMPALVGEVDIIKSFQFMPGIQGGKEGTSGLFVRGGSPDQNLILLDDVPIYSVNHIGGFFSVFDPNALKSVQLLKGSFPARYGGRLSSVLDVRLKEGNKQEHKNVLDVGLLSVRYAHEGPVKKDTSSFLFSIRRANLDIFSGIASLLATNGLFRAGYTFYDVNTKYHHIISDKDQVYLSFYGGFDRSFFRQKDSEINNDTGFKYKAKNIEQWGNLLGSFRWSHMYGKNMFSNVTLATTNYHYYNKVDIQRISKSDNNPLDVLQMDFRSYVKDLIAKIDFEYFPNAKNVTRFGSSFTHHDFNPGSISSFQKGLDITTIDTLYGSQKQRGLEWQAYVENEVHITNALSVNGGVHFASYLSGEKVYINPQPRILTSYKINNGFFLNASLSKMVQYLHLLSNPGTGVPIDLWVPVTGRIKPQSSWMYS